MDGVFGLVRRGFHALEHFLRSFERQALVKYGQVDFLLLVKVDLEEPVHTEQHTPQSCGLFRG